MALAEPNRQISKEKMKVTGHLHVMARVSGRARRKIYGVTALAVALLVAAAAPALASADFGIAFWGGDWATDQNGTAVTQAGAHPYQVVSDAEFNSHLRPDGIPVPDAATRNALVDLPPGFIGAPNSVPKCRGMRDLRPSDGSFPRCPVASIIGTVAVEFSDGTGSGSIIPGPIYAMDPPPDLPAQFGFQVSGVPVLLDAIVRTDGDYGVTIRSRNISQGLSAMGVKATFWGTPSDPSHDIHRCRFAGVLFAGSESYECIGPPGDPNIGPNVAAGAEDLAFLTNPTRCTPPGKGAELGLWVESWENPPKTDSASFFTHVPGNPSEELGVDGCDIVPFTPGISVQPTTDEAETPTGLEATLTVPQEGIENPTGLSQSNLKDTTVTLPEGMTVNPSQANGLAVCSPQQIGLTTGNSPEIHFDKQPDSCPGPSQLGEVRVDTPLLDEPLTGAVYLASQDDPASPGAENPFDSLLALYFMIEGPGTVVKLAGEISADPQTGQLKVRFLNSPQIPFSRFSVRLKGGQRAPLAMPPVCGTHTVSAELSPWARPDDPVTVSDSFKITKGPNGGPCPSGGVPPFKPGFTAGSNNNNAASYSPFVMRILRKDGEQDMTKFSATLPPGVVGKLAGVSKCPDSAIALARSKSGRQELASPSCPANSEIGRTLAGAGAGSIQTYVGGKIYLGGPYKGDPLSVIAISPIVAGPFDVGTVVVQVALTLNSKTAEVEVDGANSDPIPHILKGIPAKIRELRVIVDRDEFTLNPTSCDESSTRAELFGSFLDVINPTDDKPVALSDRFQAANCAALGFKPKLGLTLKGGTKRGSHPGLKALYKPRKGDANVKGLVVRLPRSAFLDQAHIRTICTRVQFAADNCPKGAQYGYIKAWTPLLEEPLQGPVWLRSSNHKLPDLVFDLHGLVDVEVATRIDSAKGGIRATVEDAPDAPLSKVELRMQGGKKGLIINSRNLCDALSRANVEFAGHNGKEAKANPVMRAQCGGKRR